MRLIFVPALTDAYFYLNHAKGLPGIPSAEPLRRRYVASCILLSWVAVEAALSHRLTELQRDPDITAWRSRRLSESLTLVVTRNKRRLNKEEFKRFRRIRDDIAHPKTDNNDADVTVDLASETFRFCAGVIEDLYHPIRVVYSGL